MLTVVEVLQLRPDYISVKYSQLPLAVAPGQPGDALTPSAYVLAGPGVVRVALVTDSLVDGATFYLQLTGPLPPGSWSLAVTGVKTARGEAISGAPIPFTVPIYLPPALDIPGAAQNGYDAIRQVVGPTHQGRNWEALIKSLGWSVEKNSAYARAAFDQRFLDSASGRWLTIRSAMNGLRRPPLIRMPDEPFRQLAETYVWGKLTEPGLWYTLDCFYGPDRTRAVAVSELSEPFAVTGGEQLVVEVSGLHTYTLVISAAALDSPGSASARTVASALNYSADQLGAPIWFDVWTVLGVHYVRCFTRRVGLGARLRFLGGSAQAPIRFPLRVHAFTPGTQPTWTSALVPLDAATAWSCVDPTGLDLTTVQPGDYAVVSGTEFLPANRGTFTVLSVSTTVTAGVRTQTVVLANSNGQVQTVTQLAEASLLFFRPDPISIDPAGPVINQAGDMLRVELPTTSLVVNRDLHTAAYLHERPSRAVTATRLDGVVTITATAHGLLVGQAVELRGALPSFTSPATVAGSGTTTDARLTSIWSSLPNMTHVRSEHGAVMLDTQRAMVVGGFDGTTYLPSCEVFTVTGVAHLAGGERQLTFNWSSTTDMPSARGRFAVGILYQPLGAPVVVGGYDGAATISDILQYDPVADSWSVLNSLTHARYWHTATIASPEAAFPNRVWVVGGWTGAASNSVEAYDPGPNTFATTSLTMARYRHSAIWLRGLDTVLVSGGLDAGGQPTAHCEGIGAVHSVGQMAWARYGHSLVALPDGRIAAVGGLGWPASEPGGFILRVAEVEVLDLNTWSWSSLGRRGEGELQSFAANLGGTIFTGMGGALRTYRFDNGRWGRSLAKADVSLTAPAVAGNDWLLAAGGLEGTTPTAKARILIPGRESIQAAGPPSFANVSTVLDANHFQILDPIQHDVSSWSSLTLFSGPALGSWRGPYAFDPQNGLDVTSPSTTLATSLAAGHSYADVVVAASLPANVQWIVFDFGSAHQAAPVRYLGPISATRMRIEPAFVFPKGVPAGATVTALAQKGPYMPPFGAGGIYSTPSDAATVEAKRIVLETSGAGLDRSVTIRYPGDRGMGAAGATEPKESDRVGVWSGR